MNQMLFVIYRSKLFCCWPIWSYSLWGGGTSRGSNIYLLRRYSSVTARGIFKGKYRFPIWGFNSPLRFCLAWVCSIHFIHSSCRDEIVKQSVTTLVGHLNTTGCSSNNSIARPLLTETLHVFPPRLETFQPRRIQEIEYADGIQTTFNLVWTLFWAQII